MEFLLTALGWLATAVAAYVGLMVAIVLGCIFIMVLAVVAGAWVNKPSTKFRKF